jgi:hypothetical protein
MQIIIVSLLIIIIILLVVIFLRNARSTPTITTTVPSLNNSRRLIIPEQPVILDSSYDSLYDSPYYYDSGYWFNPDWWWRGYDYVTNNYYYHHNTNYNHDNNGGHKPHPTNAPTIAPSPTTSLGSTPSLNNSRIQSLLPTGQLISPAQNSVFPLPTLGSPSANIPIPSIQTAIDVQSPVDMPGHRLPAVINSVLPETIPDTMAAKIDRQASQVIGMRGGNTQLETPVVEISPKIEMQH